MTAWFRDQQEFTVIEWPSRSPDLNPVENLWGIMVNEWTDRNERTPNMVERHYMEVWESIRWDPELSQATWNYCANVGTTSYTWDHVGYLVTNMVPILGR